MGMFYATNAESQKKNHPDLGINNANKLPRQISNCKITSGFF